MFSYLQTNNRHRWYRKQGSKQVCCSVNLPNLKFKKITQWGFNIVQSSPVSFSIADRFVKHITFHNTDIQTSASLFCFGLCQWDWITLWRFFQKGLLNRRMAHHDLLITCFIKRLICFDNLAYSVHAQSKLSNSNIASASCTSNMPSESTVYMTTAMETC